MFCSMIKNFDVGQLTDGTLYTLGLERADYLAVIVGCLIVGVIGSMKERGISVQKKWENWLYRCAGDCIMP